MKKEYDFSTAEQGKFYHPDLKVEVPVYLEPEVSEYLSKRATAKGETLDTLVNQLLKKDIELIETGG